MVGGTKTPGTDHEYVKMFLRQVRDVKEMKFDRVECKCGSCGTRKHTPSKWERHTGSRVKRWKVSIKVNDSMIPLEKLLADYNVDYVKAALCQLDEQQLFAFLQG